MAAGRLFEWHRGAYVVGRRTPGPWGYPWAAVLACGIDTTAVSHRSAAWLHELCPPPPLPVHLTTWAQSRSRKGIAVHRSASFDPELDVMALDGLPVTTVARTLLDLAHGRDLDRLCRQAHHLRTLDVGHVRALLERAAAHKSARRLARAVDALEDVEPADMTRSELEQRFLELVLRAGLPHPRVNVPLLGFVVDFYWPDHGLVVETDGARTHLTSRSFAADRARDRTLTAAGYRVARFTWTEVVQQPTQVARELRTLLRSARRSAGGRRGRR